MDKGLLQGAVQEFINNNLGADLHVLILKGSPFPGLDVRELAAQIESKNKALKKLPLIAKAQGIYYPNKRQLEQSSSEACAAYKANIVRADTVFDLTGGFGVDAISFSKKASKVTYCEKDLSLAAIAMHNFGVLGCDNIECHATDGIGWLKGTKNKADLIYLDPSRRTQDKKRVFFLADCSPNVPDHLALLLGHSPKLMIKTSPLLDIQAGLRELGPVREIHIVALQNEVKEMLWLLEEGYSGRAGIRAVNLNAGHEQVFCFEHGAERSLPFRVSGPLTYLYEPNAALMKSGGFRSIGAQFGVAKLHEHTHLYTSEGLIDFPGKRFRINNVYPYSGRTLKSWHGKKANVSTRNFPESVAVIRNRFRISDGGDARLFFTKGPDDGLIVIECEKI